MQSKNTVAVAMATVLRKMESAEGGLKDYWGYRILLTVPEAGKLYTVLRLGKIMKYVKNLEHKIIGNAETVKITLHLPKSGMNFVGLDEPKSLKIAVSDQ